MRIIAKYQNEITGQEFGSRQQCRISEKKSLGIKKMFKFWKKKTLVKASYYQRTEEEYLKLIDTIIAAVKKYEPFIYNQYKKDNRGLSRDHVMGDTFLSRWLSDNESEIYDWYLIQQRICIKCYREYDQMYFATHCYCDGTTDSWGEVVKFKRIR